MARFDIDTLLGCFARMIEKDKHLVDQFYGYLQPEILFPSAASKEEEGLRKITRMILDHHKDNTWKTVSLQTMHSQVVNMPDGELRETCLNLIKRMQTDAVVLAKASDDGCLHLFMDFLKVVAIQNWAKGFSHDFQRGRINDAIRKMKDFIPQLDKINFS